MYQISNFMDNDDVKTIDSLGPFTVVEYQRDLSVTPDNAAMAYYSNAMNVRKRQVLCDLSKAQITLQAGAMQWTVGNVNATTGIKGVGDLFGKALRGGVTGESAIKPEYTGNGLLVLEPTYKHILLVDLADWNGSIVLDDGLFLACDSRLKHKAVMRSNVSSAVAGNEGLFNLGIQGNGVVCLESACPKEELVTISLQDDVFEDRRQYGHCLERKPGLHRGALRQIPDRIRRLRRGTSQCIPWNRKGPHGAGPERNRLTEYAKPCDPP